MIQEIEMTVDAIFQLKHTLAQLEFTPLTDNDRAYFDYASDDAVIAFSPCGRFAYVGDHGMVRVHNSETGAVSTYTFGKYVETA